MWRQELRAGAKSVLPMLVGIVPFGLVAGASPVEKGLGGGVAIGFSTLVFAGASQLAAINELGRGGSAIVAALAAWTINLRLLLYSASLAPHVAREPLRVRLGLAYLLTDQAYAVSITRWTKEDDQPERRVPFFLGAGLLLWGSWQLATIAGVLGQDLLPESVPIEFAVPLVFITLLVPAVRSKPAVVAAVVGGGAAVLTAEAGGGDVAILVGALFGIVAGAVAESRWPPPEPVPGRSAEVGHE
jgi:predicted branched-subunit amino acid permease